MTDADVIEYLARKSLETTAAADELEANIDRDMEQLTADVQEFAAALATNHDWEDDADENETAV